MSEEWSWTDKDTERLEIIDKENHETIPYDMVIDGEKEWLITKLRAALREIDRLEWELNDERTGAKHVAAEAIRRTKETVKDAIYKALPNQGGAIMKAIFNAIDETEVK